MADINSSTRVDRWTLQTRDGSPAKEKLGALQSVLARNFEIGGGSVQNEAFAKAPTGTTLSPETAAAVEEIGFKIISSPARPAQGSDKGPANDSLA